MSPNENKNEFQTTELKVGSEKTIIVRSSFSSRKICWFIAFLLVMLFLMVGLKYYSEIYQNFWIFAKLLGHRVKYQK